ncbi:MAG: glutathione synthase [Gammaproteobacteria bacterium]|nr:MAG: glutathione synthase [Gammaproteobacteria bacterium]
MAFKIGVIMDPIETIKPYKDTTFAMMLEAQTRGHYLFYIELGDMYLADGEAWAITHQIVVSDQTQDSYANDNWFEKSKGGCHIKLEDLDVILMRKDPPFDMEFIYVTYILERAQQAGTLVVNDPASIRSANEKLFTSWFPQCCPETIVDRSAHRILDFVKQHQKTIIKPLDGMGGASIFSLTHNDSNCNVIIETLTNHGTKFAMVQRFIPDITKGDKRILMVNGEPIDYSLARIPASGENRANLAAGGKGEGQKLSAHDRWICSQIGPVLRKKGLLFVGLDVIGDYLTEINVTSPTCARELDSIFGINICGKLFDVIEGLVKC